jgi:HAD superfamily hydrolase (TIGR01509 family)
MIKCVIFDLDGVLVDTKPFHFEALNVALSKIDDKYVITYNEHINKYDGLSTNKKLEMLTLDKGLPKEYYKQIWEDKQELTFKFLEQNITFNPSLYELFKKLKEDGYYVCVASNSISKTIKICLQNLNLFMLVDYYLSNEDVLQPKPNPEIYLKCMISKSYSPKETMIVEDSHVGRIGAYNSGANVCPVKDCSEVTMKKIYNSIQEFNTKQETSKPEQKWKDDNLTVLIPMAGEGSRFVKAGYTFPKPLIEIYGKPMIQIVVENLNIDAQYVYIIQKKHDEKYNLHSVLNVITPGCKIVTVDSLTDGAACTTLLAKEYIDNDKQLLIANSDQYIKWNSCEYMYYMTTHKQQDGNILTFTNTHPKWSYIRYDENNYVTDVKEKEVISDKATIGIYYWRKGSDYVKYAQQMINKNIRYGTNFNGKGEFYVAPTYNEAIKDNKKIGFYDIQDMWGLGTPEDLNYFLSKKEL